MEEEKLTEDQKESLGRVTGKLVELFTEMGKQETTEKLLEVCDKIEDYLSGSEEAKKMDEITKA